MKKITKRVTVTVLVCLLVSGCASHFHGHKLGHEANPDKPVKNSGIPFTLNRPEFRLTIAPKDGETRNDKIATVTLDWVPDNKNRYTIALDPALFSNSTFDLDFNEKGYLETGTATLTSQVVPTITRLGNLAAAFVSIGILDEASTIGEIKTELDAAQKDCNEKPTTTMFGVIPNKFPTVKDGILERWGRYSKCNSSKELSHTRILARIHAMEPKEQACFKVVRGNIEASIDSQTTADDLHSEFKKAEKEYRDKYKDTPEALKQLEEVMKKHKSLAKKDLDKLQYDGFPSLESNTQAQTDLKNLIEKSINYIDRIDQEQSLAILAAIIGMEPGMWQARQAAEIEDQIALFSFKREQFALDSSERKTLGDYITALNGQLEQLVDKQGIHQQILAYEKVLTAPFGPLAGQQGARYPVEEHEKLISLVEELRNEFHQAVTSLSANTGSLLPAKNTSTNNSQQPALNKPQDEKDYVLQRATPDFVKLIGKALPDDAPKYVIVLTPENASPVLAPSNSSNNANTTSTQNLVK